MSNLRYKGPAKPVSLALDPFPDTWLMWSFAAVSAAFVWIVFVKGY